VQNNASPGRRRRHDDDNSDEKNIATDAEMEPERHLKPRLPTLLTSPGFQTLYTQQHLDTALYGYDTQNRTTVGPALSGLRQRGLSYGTS